MNSNRTKLVAAVVLTIVVFAVLSLFFWGFVRDTIVAPLYDLIWIIGLVLNSIPQGIYLAILVMISLIIGSSALRNIHIGQTVRRQQQEYPNDSARYLFWRKLHAQNQFSWNRFAWETRILILNILAYQEGVDSAQIEAMIDDGRLYVPDTVKSVIQRRAIRTSQPMPGGLERALQRLRQFLFREDSLSDLQVDQQVDEIVRFIEYRLEITHAGNQHES